MVFISPVSQQLRTAFRLRLVHRRNRSSLTVLLLLGLLCTSASVAQEVSVTGTVSPAGGPVFPLTAPNWIVPGTITVGTSPTVRGAITGQNGGFVQADTIEISSGQLGFSNGSTLQATSNISLGVMGYGQGVLQSGSSLISGNNIDLSTTSSSSSLLLVINSTISAASKIRVGIDGTGTLAASDGTSVQSHELHIGVNSGGVGTVSVSDFTPPGSTLDIAGATWIGVNGTGALVAGNSSSVESGWVWIGLNDGSQGTATLMSNASWTVNNDLNVGGNGTGMLNVESGADVSAKEVTIGALSSGHGEATVSGSGSTLSASQRLSVGWDGNHSGAPDTLIISDGASVSNGWAWIGYASAASGYVEMSGATSEWETTGDINVGGFGKGEISLLGGSISADSGTIGYAGSSTGIVSVEGADSLFNIENHLAIGREGSGSLTIQDDAIFIGGSVDVGASAGANGTLTVETSATTRIDQTLQVGAAGTGSLNVATGGQVFSDSGIIGAAAGGNGSAMVTGTGSLWDVTDVLAVGNAGTGTLNVEAGGTVESGSGVIGEAAGGTGTVTVTGTGSLWDVTNTLTVGNAGSGSLRLFDEATIDAGRLTIGNTLGGLGSVTVDGANTALNADNAFIGIQGTGHTLSITDQGQFTSTGALSIGENIDSTGKLSISGMGSGASSEHLTVGYRGLGTVRVENGGNLISEIANIGYFDWASGSSVTVTGAGSSWTGLEDFSVGVFGDSILTIEDGGLLESEEASIGNQRTSDSLITVTGANSSAVIDGTVHVGVLGKGTMEILDGGTVESSAGLVGNQGGQAEGNVLIQDSNSSWKLLGNLTIAASDTGLIEVKNGGLLESNTTLIGQFNGSQGTLQVDGVGSRVNLADLSIIGNRGEGTLDVINGGEFSGEEFRIGEYSDGTGTVTVNGTDSLLETSKGLISGGGGTSSLTVENGGKVDADYVIAGSNSTSVSDILVAGAGSLLTSEKDFSLAREGTATMEVTSGGKVDSSFLVIGQDTGSSGTLEIGGAGSRWDTDTYTSDFGRDGQGTLTLFDGGVFSSIGGTNAVLLGFGSSGEGTLNIGGSAGDPAQTAGFLEATEVIGRDGTAILRFNHLAGLSAPYHFTTDGTSSGSAIGISGSTRVIHDAGVTTFDTARTFTGGTQLNGGRLIADHAAALGSGPLDLIEGTFQPLQSVGVEKFSWSGGKVDMELGNGAPTIKALGDFIKGGNAAGGFELKHDGVTPLLQRYQLVGFGGTTNFSESDFSGGFDPNIANVSVQSRYELDGGALWLDLTAQASGSILQNSAPVLIPTFADFLVQGEVTTGTPTESNVIRSLTFDPDSRLKIFNTLEVTSGELDVPTGTARIHGGRIFAPDELQKNGAGRLELDSDFVVTNDLLIQNGALAAAGNGHAGGSIVASPNTRFELTRSATVSADGGVQFSRGARGIIDGTLISPRTFFSAGSIFQGNGTIVGDTILDGTIAPGRSIGTLTVTGDFTMGNSGRFELETARPGKLDQLVVGGRARINGTLEVAPVENYRYEHGDRLAFISADSLSGTFDSIELNAGSGFRGRFVYHDDANFGELLILNSSYTPFATNANQTALATALDQWIGIETGDIGEITLALDNLDSEWLPSAFDQILPHLQASVLELEVNGTHEDLRQLSRYFRSRATSGSYIDRETLPRWSTWTMGSGAFGDYATPAASDYESGTSLSGIDYAIFPNLSAGILIDYSEGSGEFYRGGDLDLQSTQFGAYTRYQDNAFHAYSAFGIGELEQDYKRPIHIPGLNRDTYGNGDGHSASGLLGGGYDFSIGPWKFGPEVSLQYARAQFSDHHENGAGALDLAYRDLSTESLRSYVGLRLSRNFETAFGLNVIPELHATWRREYLTGPSFEAVLDSGSGPGFSYNTSRDGGDVFELGSSLTIFDSIDWSAGFHYRAIFDSESVNHTVGLSATVHFGNKTSQYLKPTSVSF
ncbi:MAG: autotransporter domain-containing protein [Verrucomicrobiales bacterium]|nr:autotransporter domain-containing protein [Verrucomicrobiales bacterium]